MASPFNSSVYPVLSSTYRPRSGRASHPIGVARSRQRTSESQSIESSQRPCARPPTCNQGHIRTENLLINVIGRKDLRSVTKISQGVTCRSGRPPDCWPLSGQQETMVTGKNRIMIYGPKIDGTYVVEFRMADGEVLAISVPAGETRVLKHFPERMPYGLFVPDVRTG